MRGAILSVGIAQWTGAEEAPVAFAEMLCGWSEGPNPPVGWGPADVSWIVRDEMVVGQCDVRLPLTPRLRDVGGNEGTRKSGNCLTL
jgi:hypothetical protein